MNSTEITFNANPKFTIDTISQLAFFNGFAIYRSKFHQAKGAVLICGEPHPNMLQKFSQDYSTYYIIIPDEDRAKELKYYFSIYKSSNIHIFDCNASELPFNYTLISMAFVNTNTKGLSTQFYSEMYRCLNLEMRT